MCWYIAALDTQHLIAFSVSRTQLSNHESVIGSCSWLWLNMLVIQEQLYIPTIHHAVIACCCCCCFTGTIDVSQPFAIAGQDVPKQLVIPKPQQNTNRATVRSQQGRKQGVRTPAADGLLRPADFPEECPNGECPAMWNMNYLSIPDIWDTSVPVNSITVKATLIDTGADFSHNDLQGQLDQANSATFNPAGNVPAGGWADRGVEPECMSLHGTHVTGTVAGGWGNGDTRGEGGS